MCTFYKKYSKGALYHSGNILSITISIRNDDEPFQALCKNYLVKVSKKILVPVKSS